MFFYYRLAFKRNSGVLGALLFFGVGVRARTILALARTGFSQTGSSS
jgi:hypothetical protein